MGLIKAITNSGIVGAAKNSIGGALADSYLEAFKAARMDMKTVIAPGVFRDAGQGRNTNTNRLNNVISNGSMVEVSSGQLMCLVDGGRIVDYSAEPGYYKVQNSSQPSFFNGTSSILPSIKESLDRIRFGGNNFKEQRIIYVNLRTMEGIKFGTKAPITYHDVVNNIYAEIRTNGTFSIKLVDPWKFINEVAPNECIMEGAFLNVEDFMNQTFMSEFNTALGTSLSRVAAENRVPVDRINEMMPEIAAYLRDALDEEWTQKRGFQVESVGLNQIHLDDETIKLLKEVSRVNQYNDPSRRETMRQLGMVEALKAAGNNQNGAMMGFAGIGMGMNAFNADGAANMNMQQMQMQQQQQPMNNMGMGGMQQPMNNNMGMGGMQQPMNNNMNNMGMQQQAPAAAGWTCACGQSGNQGKFCANCGKPKPEPQASGEWSCPACGAKNTGKFCADCGKPRPAAAPKKIKCDKCGYEPDMSKPVPKFCPNCGDPINEADFA